MYEHILNRVYNQPHLVRAEKLEIIRQVVTARALGWNVDGKLLEHFRAEAANRRRAWVTNTVGVLPILGTLTKRGGMIVDSSGMASTDAIGREFDSMVADESVGSILLDVDSPGGEVFGVPELADKIYAARGRKPIEASVNAEMGSGALWIGTAADSVSITPSGWIGSLGVYMVHSDLSKINEEEGLAVTYISAGEYKVEGNPDTPLSEEAKTYYQGQVDAIYADFLKAVAKHRGTTVADARANYGKGRMLRADAAKAVGMVVRIETIEATIMRMATGGKRRAAARAERLALEYL